MRKFRRLHCFNWPLHRIAQNFIISFGSIAKLVFLPVSHSEPFRILFLHFLHFAGIVSMVLFILEPTAICLLGCVDKILINPPITLFHVTLVRTLFFFIETS